MTALWTQAKTGLLAALAGVAAALIKKAFTGISLSNGSWSSFDLR